MFITFLFLYFLFFFHPKRVDSCTPVYHNVTVLIFLVDLSLIQLFSRPCCYALSILLYNRIPSFEVVRGARTWVFVHPSRLQKSGFKCQLSSYWPW